MELWMAPGQWVSEEALNGGVTTTLTKNGKKNEK
jgi:hypothetical protein